MAGRGTAQDLVPVTALFPEENPGTGAMLLMYDNSFRVIIRCGTINFDMRNAKEQLGVIFGYSDFLDSLDTPIEIYLHPKRLDTEAYVRQYETMLRDETISPKLRAIAQAHVDHYRDMARAQSLLQREIYVIIQARGVTGQISDSVSSQFPFMDMVKAFTSSADRNLKREPPTGMEIAQARAQLTQRTELVLGQLGQFGVWARPLDEEQVRRLLAECFNPVRAERQRANLLSEGGLGLGVSRVQRPARRRPPAQLPPARDDS